MEERFAKSAYHSFLLWGICSSFGVTVSTLIDAILVGNFVGSDGLAVTNLSTPVFLLYSLLGITVGTGANILTGRQLGEADVKQADRTFNAQISAGFLIGILLMVCLVVFGNEICILLGARGELFYLANSYLFPVFFSAPIFVIYHIFALSVRTDGDPKLAAAAAATVIAVNLCLDFLFMLGFGMGIVGASLSLCIAETSGLAVLLTESLFGSPSCLERLCPEDERIFEHYYPVQEKSVVQISEDLERLCDEWSIQLRQALFINLITEEILLNIIRFGLKNMNRKYYIAVRLLEKDGEYVIRIRDNVSTYNPFDPENTGGDAVDAAVIGMIQRKIKYCYYQRKLIFNYLYLII